MAIKARTDGRMDGWTGARKYGRTHRQSDTAISEPAFAGKNLKIQKPKKDIFQTCLFDNDYQLKESKILHFFLIFSIFSTFSNVFWPFSWHFRFFTFPYIFVNISKSICHTTMVQLPLKLMIRAFQRGVLQCCTINITPVVKDFVSGNIIFVTPFIYLFMFIIKYLKVENADISQQNGLYTLQQ